MKKFIKIAKNTLAKSNNINENIIFDKKGNVITSLTILMIFSFILAAILVLNVAINYNNISSESIDSNNFNYLIQDYKRNIPIITKESIGEISNKTIETHIPCENSNIAIQNKVNEKLKEVNKKYEVNQGLNVESEVLSISNSDDPFHIDIKTVLYVKKGNLEYNQVINQKVSIENLKDPLPFLMCKDHPTLIENNTKINYKDSLKYYFTQNNLENPDSYENASSPLIIKKCPYDPYQHHGDSYTLKNCIDNGYYHESADGSCYLCRLEGKGGCFHYGLETFIVPKKVDSLNLRSISSPDHVIFAEHYAGNPLEFYRYENLYEIIFLDSSHRAKYGLGG
ncbi:MAG: hypothetical protein LBU74_05845 [Methanobacteriaceae archaeon]|nr:hypothetical protein [Candidatus Methanorudis spinitermitis]